MSVFSVYTACVYFFIAVVFNLSPTVGRHLLWDYFIVNQLFNNTSLSPAVSADKFRYTCTGGDVTIEGVDDKKDLEETRRTFSMLGKNRTSCQAVVALNVTFILAVFSLFGFRRVEGRLSVGCLQSVGSHIAFGQRGDQRLREGQIIS